MYRFALATAFVSFLLVIAGGLVTSTGSGLSVPDWPLSYGKLFPPMVGGIRFEHSHRLIAATVGLLTLILTVWVLFSESRRWVRRLAIGAFGLVVLQGILGGLTVLWQLPVPISVAHACLGQIFFTTLVLLATVLSPAWAAREKSRPSLPPLAGPFRLCLTTTLFLFGQLILGATIRHRGWQPLWVGAHAIGAIAVFIVIARTAARILRQCRADPFFKWPAQGMTWLLTLQILFGIATLVRGGGAVISTAHLAVGALLLAASTLLTVRVHRFLSHSVSPFDPNHRPLAIYLELTKPRLTGLALLTGLIGFLLASEGALNSGKLLLFLLGTALVGAGAGALNQYLERDEDSKMKRTCRRPIPSGRISPRSAWIFGIWTSVAGVGALTLAVNLLAGLLAAFTLTVYLLLYTPLKKRSALCTLVGAIPGAMPPLIGWAAARGSLELEVWLLFGILFLWQLPHFLAIAWIHREDYMRAGFKMLPVLDPEGGSTGRQIALYSLALVPVSLLPATFGVTGWIYFLTALVGSVAFLGFGLSTALLRSRESAHRLFFASVLYLPFLLATMTLDRMIG